jgi:ribose 5-phosphate isomerase RpiB
MKIALINENSQAAKNELIFNTLKESVKPLGHEVINIGMFNSEDKPLTYVQNGILAALLLNSKAVDFVITGCGTGEGAMLACNAFKGVNCGLIIDPSDAYMFGQINDGNCASFPFAKGFGWGAELNLGYCFKNLFEGERGQGYPKERREPEQRNKKILDVVKNTSFKDLEEVIPNLDRELVLGAIDRPSFKDFFLKNSKVDSLTNMVENLLK